MADTINAKKLNTRIKLKYDSYANWQASTIKLLKGELAICEIPAVEGKTSVSVNADAPAANIPTVLFKVGDGTKTFSQLPWASAKAADVHAWAKATEMKLVGTKLTFVDANGQAINGIPAIDLDTTFATDAEVETIRAALAADIADINKNLGNTTGIGKDVADLKAAMEIVRGGATVTGSIEKAKTEAITAAASDATTKAGTAKTEAVAAAKSYTDTEVGKIGSRTGTLETLTAGHTTDIADNKSAIEKEVADRKSAITTTENAYKAADTAINNKIGTKNDAAGTDTVYGAIKDAKAEGTAAKNSIATLTGDNGAITKNTAGVAQNKADIAALTQTVTNNKTALENADKALGDRLNKIELFFGEADADGKPTGEGLYDALDTLQEIQDFIKGEGSAADTLAETVAGHTTSIKNINDSLAEGGTIGGAIKTNTANISGLSTRVGTAEQTISGHTTDITGLKAATAGFDATKTIAAKFTSVESTLSTTTQTANDAKDVADANAEALTELTKDGGRIATVEAKASTNTQGITNINKALADYTGANAIKTKFASVDTAVENAANAAAAAQNAASTADGKAVAAQSKANEAYTLASTANGTANSANTLAGSNQTRIAAIEADYLAKADYFIIDCGDADENDFAEPTA